MFVFLSYPAFCFAFTCFVLAGLYIYLWFTNRAWIRGLDRFCREWSGPAICFFGSVVLICGVIGFSADSKSLQESLYETAQLYFLNVSSSELACSTWLSLAMLAATLLAITLATKAIFFLFRDSSVSMRLMAASEHVVICGLGRIGCQLLSDLFKANDHRTVVVIELNGQHPELKWAREQGALIVSGDATDRESLTAAGIRRAGEVFVVTGSDECNIECAIEISELLVEAGRRRRLPWKCSYSDLRKWRYDPWYSPLRCYVHLMNRDLMGAMRTRSDAIEQLADEETSAGGKAADLSAITHRLANWLKMPAVPKTKTCEIDVFNALERTTRRLLEDIATSRIPRRTLGASPNSTRETTPTLDLQTEPMRPTNTDEVAHYLVLGFGEFGQTLALQLAELAHFENRKRLRLTIADHQIKRTAKAFIARHPRFGPRFGEIPDWDFNPAADDWGASTYRPVDDATLPSDSLGISYACNAQYVEYIEATDDRFLRGMNRAFSQPHVKPAVLICFEEDRKNFALAERMKSKLETLGYSWPIFVWIPRQRELSQLLTRCRIRMPSATPASSLSPANDLIPFGECYGSVAYREVTAAWVDWLARLIYLVWREPAKSVDPHAVREFQAAVRSDTPADMFAGLDWTKLVRISEIEWDLINDCDGWEKASNRAAAIHAAVKAAAAGYRIIRVADASAPLVPANWPADGSPVELLDEKLRAMEHHRWIAERLVNGWRYDKQEKKNNILKTRWQITPWEHLDLEKHGFPPDLDENQEPKDERWKDQVIVTLLTALIRCGKLVVERVSN